MTYFKQYKDESEKREITKEEAKRILSGWWNEDALDDIFDNDIEFRLWTPYTDVWTMTEDGKVPIAGFYGTVS